jgi:micrococcal nuclease
LANRVVDGDTFHIRYNDKDYKIRLLDVDTPEINKTGVLKQAFSEEACSFTKEMVLNKQVKLPEGKRPFVRDSRGIYIPRY